MGNKLYIILRNALRGFENLRLVLTKRRKAYVTMIGSPATVLSLTTMRTKKIESSVVSVKTVSKGLRLRSKS